MSRFRVYDDGKQVAISVGFPSAKMADSVTTADGANFKFPAQGFTDDQKKRASDEFKELMASDAKGFQDTMRKIYPEAIFCQQCGARVHDQGNGSGICGNGHHVCTSLRPG